MVEEKCGIVGDRLQCNHYYKNKFIWLNIIFQLEKIPLLNYIHFKFNHIKRETMEEKIMQLGFYWHGYLNDVIDFINKCGVSHSENVGKKLPNNPKIIITYGPNKRYQ